MMKCTLSASALTLYVTRQLNHFFPDATPITTTQTKKLCPEALRRLETCVAASPNKYSFRDGHPYFDHLYSDHYAMFIYLLARVAGESGTAKDKILATKLYLLNKALHSVDVYFEVQLPDIFLFAHPLGTVLGRAKYGDYLVVMQNCTVGNADSRYPTIGKRVVLCAGASVLGNSVLADGVCVGAGSLLVNAKVPANATVVGRGNELRVMRGKPARWTNYFKA